MCLESEDTCAAIYARSSRGEGNMAHRLDALADLEKTNAAYLHFQDGHPVRVFDQPPPGSFLCTWRFVFKNGKHDFDYDRCCKSHFPGRPFSTLPPSHPDDVYRASVLGKRAGSEEDDIAILTALTAVLTASVADAVSSSAVASVEDSDASHSSVDKATVLDSSGSEADNPNETLEVLIAPLDYVPSLEDHFS